MERDFTPEEMAEDQVIISRFLHEIIHLDDPARTVGILLTSVKMVMGDADVRVRLNFCHLLAEVLHLKAILGRRPDLREPFDLERWTPPTGTKES